MDRASAGTSSSLWNFVLFGTAAAFVSADANATQDVRQKKYICMHACNPPKKQSRPVSYLTVQEGVVVGGGNPLLVPGLAEELGRGVLGLVLGKVEAEGLEGDRLGDRLGRSGGGRTGGGEGGGRGGEGEDEALREGSHFCLLYKSDC